MERVEFIEELEKIREILKNSPYYKNKPFRLSEIYNYLTSKDVDKYVASLYVGLLGVMYETNLTDEEYKIFLQPILKDQTIRSSFELPLVMLKYLDIQAASKLVAAYVKVVEETKNKEWKW